VRALTGAQERGDPYIRVCLEVFLKEPHRIVLDRDVRVQIYSLFREIWMPLAESEREARSENSASQLQRSVDAKLEALAPAERQMLLLTSLESFSTEEAAQILSLSLPEAEHFLARAWDCVHHQLATTVLIIEDEPIIALDVAAVVQELGHAIVGITGSQTEAIAMARSRRPGLVLADINLGEGGSGLTAVNEILKSVDVPVIFVTAYPERLLTGEKPEPTYLVTKPFTPDTLKATIFQALSVAPAVIR
jgi:CheY-like chemotaxis protein